MGLPALAADYLFIGPLMKARLEDKVGDIPVQLCETVEQVLKADQRKRVLLLLWAGDRVDTGADGSARAGASQLLHQRWLVILGLDNVSPSPDARNVAAGPLLSKVHQALAGWAPPGAATRTMRRASAPLQPTFTPSKAVYPLGFEITLTL
ncbi:MAG: hypothetical protein RJA10_4814 [Pseudomonadota bacterium]